MAFTACNFVYADIPTEHHRLIISSIDGSGVSDSPSGSQNSLTTDRVFRNPKHYLLAVDQPEPLTFEVELSSAAKMDKFEVAAVASWLTEQKEYKKLQIDQKDLKNAYFNCIFTNMSNIYYMNNAFSFRCTVVCDAPWAWEFPKTKRWNLTDKSTHVDKIFNTSSYRGLLFPTVEFKLYGSNRNFSITNKSLDNLTFSWTDLQPEETIWCNCNTQEITSSTGLFRSDKFNKKFLALKDGENILEFNGFVEKLLIKYQFALKVGG